MKLMIFMRGGLLVAVLGVFGFLALRSSPHVGEIAWIPRWLGAWADAHGVMRNLPAFAGLYLVAVGCTKWRFRHHVLGGICVLAAALEGAQNWMPGRFPGWDDIVASWAGVALGYAAACTVKALAHIADKRRRPAVVAEQLWRGKRTTNDETK